MLCYAMLYLFSLLLLLLLHENRNIRWIVRQNIVYRRVVYASYIYFSFFYSLARSFSLSNKFYVLDTLKWILLCTHAHAWCRRDTICAIYFIFMYYMRS